LNTKLFIQFAGKRLFRALAGLDLAAGELPLQRHGLIRTALTDEDFAAAHDERSRNKTKGGADGPGVGIWRGFFHNSSVNALMELQRSHAVLLPNPTGQSRSIAQNRDPGAPGPFRDFLRFRLSG